MNKQIIRVLNRLKLLRFLNINGALNLNNRIFKIPILGKMGTPNLSISEPWMIAVLEIILKNNQGRFIDIGVNIGQTLLKFKCVNDKVDYVGFEPNPACVFYSKRLIQANNFRNCEIIPIGISNATELGILNFQNSSATDSGASMISNFRSIDNNHHTEYIPLFNIDQIKKIIGIEEFSILKIDVEGAELEVIKSFYELIKNNQPVILLEILPAYQDNNQFRIQRQNEIISIVTDLNYSIFRVIKKNEVFIGFEEISKIEVHSDLNNCDYVLVPKHRKEELSKWQRI